MVCPAARPVPRRKPDRRVHPADRAHPVAVADRMVRGYPEDPAAVPYCVCVRRDRVFRYPTEPATRRRARLRQVGIAEAAERADRAKTQFPADKARSDRHEHPSAQKKPEHFCPRRLRCRQDPKRSPSGADVRSPLQLCGYRPKRRNLSCRGAFATGGGVYR